MEEKDKVEQEKSLGEDASSSEPVLDDAGAQSSALEETDLAKHPLEEKEVSTNDEGTGDGLERTVIEEQEEQLVREREPTTVLDTEPEKVSEEPEKEPTIAPEDDGVDYDWLSVDKPDDALEAPYFWNSWEHEEAPEQCAFDNQMKTVLCVFAGLRCPYPGDIFYVTFTGRRTSFNKYSIIFVQSMVDVEGNAIVPRTYKIEIELQESDIPRPQPEALLNKVHAEIKEKN